MTMTPSTPSELLAMNANQVFAENLTPVEIVEKLCHHSDLGPAEIITVMKGLADKVFNFHANVLKNTIQENDGNLPADEVFWAIDTQKMETIVTLMKDL